MTQEQGASLVEILVWKDVKKAILDTNEDEVRFLVSNYNMMQEQRIRWGNQNSSLTKRQAPHSMIIWSQTQFTQIEKTLQKALTYYIREKGNPVDHWALSVVGVGPIMAAGLKAHIDINKAPTFGHIERFAGLDPKVTWEKGKKRPWNADLKSLCWLIGESFAKFCNHPEQVYGSVYRQRKDYEIELNEKLAFAAQAEEKLKRYNIRKETDAYKYYSVGKLPPAHIHARAKRFALKRFLSHYHQVLFETTFNKPAPLPWIIEFGGHAHLIDPPNYTPLPRQYPRPIVGDRVANSHNF